MSDGEVFWLVVNIQLFALGVMLWLFPNGLPQSRWLRPVEVAWEWVLHLTERLVGWWQAATGAVLSRFGRR